MSIRASVARFILRHFVRRKLARNPDIESVRAMVSLAETGIRLKKTSFPDIRVDSTSLGGVPAELLTPPRQDARRAILFLHGGAWVVGSPRTHRPLTTRLAHLVGTPVYAVDYRLAPEHPYPAGLDDSLCAYEALRLKGIPASGIFVAGDSAGGNLALALCLRLKAEKRDQPSGLALLSPATDLTASGESYVLNAGRDDVFTPDLMPRFAPLYAPETDLKNPFVSPLFGDVSGLPPTLFQVADTELLLDDSVRMARKMRDSGVEAILQIWPGMWHDWQLSADSLPEGEDAVNKMAEFAAKCLRLRSNAAGNGSVQSADI